VHCEANALSRQEPVRPMDRRSPSRSQTSMQAAEVYSLPRMLSCLSSGSRLHVRLGWRLEEEVDLAGDVALAAADDLELGVALGDAAGDVVLGALVDAHAGDHDQVQRRVGVAVAAPMQPVALVLPEEAASGAAAHSIAKAAPLRRRWGCRRR
jgi:hypothetical protein